MHLFFTAALLLLSTAHSAVAQTYPATAEFDFVFPRNESYAPTALMPLVFAFRHPSVWIPLIPLLQWSIQIMPSGDFVDTGARDLSWGIDTTTDPYFEFHSSQALKAEGNYSITWTLYYGNCTTQTDGELEIPDPNNIFLNRTMMSTYFSIRKGAQEVDLATAASCSGRQGLALNVTTTEKVGNPSDWKQRDMCGVLANRQPTPDPCAVQFDTSVASSIAASLTAVACINHYSGYTGPCPPKPTNAGAGARGCAAMYALLVGTATVVLNMF